MQHFRSKAPNCLTSFLRTLALILALVVLSDHTTAEVRTPAVIGDGMVLQRERANPIWGWAAPDEKVTVNFADSTVETTADKNGRWKVLLPALKANHTGRTLSVRGSGGSSLELHDVLVGEVWLFTGPSNIYWPVERCDNAKEAISAADLPEIRFFTTPKRLSDTPEADCKGSWTACSPKTVGKVSGVAYFFSRRIHHDLDVPIGALQSFWGGSRCESWTSVEAVEKEPALAPVVDWWNKEIAEFDADAAAKENRRALARWKREAQEAKKVGKRAPKKPAAIENPAKSRHRPGQLFNGMISPLIPFGMRGAVTYQGLGNLFWAEHSVPLMATMFRDWRERWGLGDFPIGMIQPAPFPCDGWASQHPDAYALQREAQLLLLDRLPNLGLATTMDIGDLTDVHFRNKQEVGRRMALWALEEVYGRPAGYGGPIYESMAVEGDSIRIRFKHTAKGLKTRDGKAPTDFTVAGQEGRFFPARARIDGDTVVVKSEKVARPVSARFAWTDVAIPNLINSEGLPASIFRTDFPR